MKKELLACIIVACSSFSLLYAQLPGQAQQVNVNVRTNIDGKTVQYNSQTGQVGVTDSKGRGVQYNANTGAIGIGGTINGTKIGIGYAGVSAQASSILNSNLSGPLQLLALVKLIVSSLVPILMLCAVLAFFWFLVTFIWKGKDNPDKQQEGIKGMMWSLIALFVMVSLWGIIGLAGRTLGIGQGGSMPVPKFPGQTK